MAKMGRPTKLTKKLTDRLCAILRGGAYRKDALAILGINNGTFCNWMAKGENEQDEVYMDFREAVHRAEAFARTEPSNCLSSAAITEPKRVETWLRMRWPGEYSEHRIKTDDAERRPITVNITGLPRPPIVDVEDD